MIIMYTDRLPYLHISTTYIYASDTATNSLQTRNVCIVNLMYAYDVLVDVFLYFQDIRGCRCMKAVERTS